jgi:hypothetical protein
MWQTKAEARKDEVMTTLYFAENAQQSWRAVFPAAVASLLLWTVAFAANAAQFEMPSSRKASEILPPELLVGPRYRIQEKVVSYGYMHHWAVGSDFGTFEVTGDGALRKLLREIRAIAALKEVSTAEAAGNAVVLAAKRPFQFFGDLVTHPVDTVSGIPEGVGTIFANVSEAISMEHDPSEDSRLEQALFVSSWKRDFCAEFDCDVYSSNKVLQKELNRLGWAASIGGLTVSAASMAASVTVVSVLSNMRLADQIKDALNEEPPSRLKIINEKNFLSAGVPPNLVERFLAHPYYTPRHDTIIATSMAGLGSAASRGTFIEAALQAQDEVAATFYMNIAQTMLGYHDTVAPLKQLAVVYGFPVARSSKNSVLMPFPLDHGVWSERGSQVMKALMEKYKAKGFTGGFDLWVTGTLSPIARERLTALGYRVTENVDEKIGFLD